MAKFSLKIKPNSKQTSIIDGEIINIRLAAPPRENQANEALIELLKSKLRVPKNAIRIVSGATSRFKTIEVEGLDQTEIRSRLTSGLQASLI